MVVAEPTEMENPDALLLRAFREGGYICFLTVGGKENRAWPIRKGLTAWEAGGTIHTDIQKGFIRAEIISFAEFIEAGGETQAKRAGKMRLETKQYVMQDSTSQTSGLTSRSSAAPLSDCDWKAAAAGQAEKSPVPLRRLSLGIDLRPGSHCSQWAANSAIEADA